jgi:hypothetical protein
VEVAGIEHAVVGNCRPRSEARNPHLPGGTLDRPSPRFTAVGRSFVPFACPVCPFRALTGLGNGDDLSRRGSGFGCLDERVELLRELGLSALEKVPVLPQSY